MIATLSLRKEELKNRRDAAGFTSNTALAERMGTDPSTVARVLAGTVVPSGAFIAALLVALTPHARFEDLFELHRVKP